MAGAERSCWEESRMALAEPAEMAPAGNAGRGKGRGGPETWGGAGRCQGWAGQMKGAQTTGDTQPGCFLGKQPSPALALWAWGGWNGVAKRGAGLPGAARGGSSHGTVPRSPLPQFPPSLVNAAGWWFLWWWNQPCSVLTWRGGGGGGRRIAVLALHPPRSHPSAHQCCTETQTAFARTGLVC